MPINASRPAACTSSMPWSPHSAIRCVPTRPLVVKPQMKNVANRNQKVVVLEARARAPNVAANMPVRGATGAGGACGSLPNGTRPTLAGRSGTSHQASGTIAAAAAATVHTTRVQSPEDAKVARMGRKTRVPLAVLAVSRPIIRPRCLVNQRFTIVAPSTDATAPELKPENTPQLISKCQGSVMYALTALEADIRISAVISTRRKPKRSIAAAAKGPTSP
ncbi:hypothetical protein D3C86_1505470 [compost metagenome]